MKLEYRPEIDGLRALAVLPVILFHAGFAAFSGGFVGVDVFFVISGYLITSILIKELAQGSFSLVNFYERRARRILPALFLMMFVCIPLAWFLLMPSDLKDFSQSLVAVSAFASNILFSRESGYFATAAELKPLLHTWSLAVEEQYYLLFPPLLMIVWRLGTRRILILLAAIGIASLGLSQWVSTSNPAAAFYLLPTRGWELLAGACTALYMATPDRIKFGRRACEFLGWSGLALLLYSVLAFGKETPFPGFYALVPTLGAALIVQFATHQTTVGRFLGNRYFVGIGLISYSAYLWHQPLFAFARQSGLPDNRKLAFLALSLLSLILGYLSWKFVETPFRSKFSVNRTQIFLFGLVGTVFFISTGFIGHFSRGNLGQLSEEQRKFLASFENEIPSWNYFTRTGIPEKYRTDCDFYDIMSYRLGRATRLPVDSISNNCFTPTQIGRKQIFIWGDSHAQQLYYGLNKVLGAEFEILQVASSGCVAALGATVNNGDYCEYSNWFAWNAINKIKPKLVIVGQNLDHNPEKMKKIAAALLNAGVQNVVFTGPTPHWMPSLPSLLSRRLSNVPRRTFRGLDEDILALDKHLRSQLSGSPNIRYVSLIDYFCNSDGCVTYYGDDVASGITSWDYGHITPIASYLFAKDVLAPQIKEKLEFK